MRNFASAAQSPVRREGLTNPMAVAFRKLAFGLLAGLAAIRQPHLTRIDPDRWSDAMLRDIGLHELTHRPTDWRLR
jgi:hypothetical protein